MKTRMHLTSLDPDELKGLLAEQGFQAYRTDQLLDWVYRKLVFQSEQMGNLPGPLRDWLDEHASVLPFSLAEKQLSTDGTVKFAFRLQDGYLIEAVSIPMETGKPTFCISSQVGCAMGCRFCATASMGFKRNLEPGEIVSQVLALKQHAGLGEKAALNIVFMGMGEPLMNTENVLKAIRILTHENAGNISHSRITVSTCGITPGIERLAAEPKLPLIALSLNAADPETREQIMPVTRKYPLREVLDALKQIPLARRERLTMEYVLLKDINDRPEDARNLVRLLDGLKYKVNLIPFNPFPGSPYQAPTPESVHQFTELLASKHVTAMVRKSRGQDIQGACGQLARSRETQTP